MWSGAQQRRDQQRPIAGAHNDVVDRRGRLLANVRNLKRLALLDGGRDKRIVEA